MRSTVVDSQFWKQEMASPEFLQGTVKAIPENKMQLGLLRSCGFARAQQLAFLHKFVFIPVLPSYVDDPLHQGGVALERLLFSVKGFNWWAALTGQFRVQKCISFVRQNQAENIQQSADLRMSSFLKTLTNQALYAIGLFSKISIGSRTSLIASSEVSGTRKGNLSKGILRHKFQNHDLTMEASYNEKYVKTDGSSWEIPFLFSVNFLSRGSYSGLHYAFSISNNSGLHSDQAQSSELPFAVSPGLRAKSVVIMDKQCDIWKSSNQGERKPFNLFYIRPHISLSALVGGSCDALLGKYSFNELRSLLTRQTSLTIDSSNESKLGKQRPIFAADIFASLGCSAQAGKFQRMFFDLTKLDTHLEFGMPSKFVIGNSKRLHDFFKLLPDTQTKTNSSHSSAVLMLQQQIVGPLCARIDSRFSLEELLTKSKVQSREIAFGLDWSLPTLGAAKVLAWYSPTLNQGMVEFRLLDE